MKNNKKQTAVSWLKDQIIDNKYIYIEGNTLMIPNDIFRKAQQMEREQMFDFVDIVLNDTECSFTGTPIVIKPLRDIYDDTYGKET